MARAYGFRVFIVEAYPNQIKGNEPFTANGGSGLAGEIALLLDRLERKGTQRYESRLDEAGNPTKPAKTATVTSSTVVRPDLIHARIAVGEEGSHVSATKPKKKARNLDGWSAEAGHAVALVFPQKNESRFFLVTQTQHRRDPHWRLLAMLRDESKLVRTERQNADAATRESARAAGTSVPRKKEFKRLVFSERQASDNEYLDELLSGADAATVVFKSRRPDAVGTSRPVDRILHIKLRDQNIFDVGRLASRSWVAKWRAGSRPTQQEAVSEVAGLLEERDLLDEGEDARYETAAISVHGKSADARTTISVDTLRDAFTYPLSDMPPITYAFYEKVGDRLKKIARQEGIEFDPIDPHEVSRCLTDSTPAVS